jgi:hypothetical protein
MGNNPTMELKDGTVVRLNQFHACEGDVFPCSVAGTYIEVIDNETDQVLTTFMGTLPEDDDEEIIAFCEKVNAEVGKC